jgi:hypothetical protein
MVAGKFSDTNETFQGTECNLKEGWAADDWGYVFQAVFWGYAVDCQYHNCPMGSITKTFGEY